MKYYALIALLLALSTHPCHSQPVDTAAVYKRLFKCWRSVTHEYSNIYGLEEDEIKNYARQKICFTRNGIELYDGVRATPDLAIKKVDAELFATENFDVPKVKLGMISDSLYKITITSTRTAADGTPHKMTDIIAFDGDFVYVTKDGVIFKLFDSENKVSGRNSN